MRRELREAREMAATLRRVQQQTARLNEAVRALQLNASGPSVGGASEAKFMYTRNVFCFGLELQL
jgi:hypothetical protein